MHVLAQSLAGCLSRTSKTRQAYGGHIGPSDVDILVRRRGLSCFRSGAVHHNTLNAYRVLLSSCSVPFGVVLRENGSGCPVGPLVTSLAFVCMTVSDATFWVPRFLAVVLQAGTFRCRLHLFISSNLQAFRLACFLSPVSGASLSVHLKYCRWLGCLLEAGTPLPDSRASLRYMRCDRPPVSPACWLDWWVGFPVRRGSTPLRLRCTGLL